MLLRSWKTLFAKPLCSHRSRRRANSQFCSQSAEVLEDRVLLSVSSGSLDVSFGDGGMVTTTEFTGSQRDFPDDVVIAADGSIIVAGFTDPINLISEQPDFALARFTPDGQLDASFGDGGLVRTDFGFDEKISHLALDASGGIFAVGTTFNDDGEGNQFRLAVARYHADGSLDTGFGIDGLASTVVGNRFASVAGVALVEGDIIVAGRGVDGPSASEDLVLVRYNSDGSLNTSFGENGILREDFGGDVTIRSLATDSAGRLIAVGEFEDQITLEDDVLIVRYLTDGTLDSTFGAGGMVQLELGTSFERAFTVATSGSGATYQIVVGVDQLFTQGVLLRITESGDLDQSFGTSGKVEAIINPNRDLLVDSTGRILAVGNSTIVRYDANGQLDVSFGGDGSIEPVGVSFRDLAIDGSGQIVASGLVGRSPGTDFGVTRYSDTGTLDENFGEAGIATANFFGPFAAASHGTERIPSTGKILTLAGGTQLTDFFLTQYNPDGSLDDSFGENGQIRFDTGILVNRFMVDDQERIVVMGEGRPDGVRRIGVMRFLPDGSLDESFDEDGILFTELNAFPIDVDQDAQGRLVVLGNAFGLDKDIVIARINENGTLDTGFGTDGIAESFVGFRFTHDVLVDADNRILVVDRDGVARYLENGDLDTGFGTAGIVGLSFPFDEYDAAVVDDQGRILVGGNTGNGFAVRRLNEDGSKDTAFGSGTGFSSVFVGGGAAVGELLLDAKDRIVAAGSAFSQFGIFDFAAVRWDANGVRDLNFGVARSNFSASFFIPVTGAAIDAQGHILVGGRVPGGIGLARFIGDVPKVESADVGGDLQSITIQLIDDEIQAGLVNDPANYRVTLANGDANGDGDFFNDGDESQVGIAGIIYDPAADRITLQLLDAVFADVYRLEIDGDDATTDGTPGLANQNGFFLEGGDFQMEFDLRVLTFVEALLDKVESLGLATNADQSLTGRLTAATQVLGADVDSDDGLTQILKSFRLGVEGWFDRGEISEADRDDLFADVDLILLGLALV